MARVRPDGLPARHARPRQARTRSADIVKNERRQGVDNQPYGKVGEILARATYPATNPYSSDVIGSMDDLSAASADDVKGFFRTYYAPNNAFLSIVGDFDPVQAKAVGHDVLQRHLAR